MNKYKDVETIKVIPDQTIENDGFNENSEENDEEF